MGRRARVNHGEQRSSTIHVAYAGQRQGRNCERQSGRSLPAGERFRNADEPPLRDGFRGHRTDRRLRHGGCSHCRRLGLAAGGLYFVEHRHEWARERTLSRFHRFQHLRDEALFQGTLLHAVHDTGSAGAAQDVAREALALADMRDDAYLDPAEKEEIADSSYELLVVLSSAVAAPQPGQSRRGR